MKLRDVSMALVLAVGGDLEDGTDIPPPAAEARVIAGRLWAALQV